MQTFIDHNGVRLFVAIKGTGIPLIMIHGLGGNHHNLEDVISIFSNSYKVYALDCRGHGLSDKPNKISLQDYVEDVIFLLDYYNISQAYLLGVSMGSYIAQGVAIQIPERITKLVLTVTKPKGLVSSLVRIYTENATLIKGLDDRARTLKLLHYFVCDPVKMKDKIDYLLTDLSPQQFKTASDALKNFDFRNDLPKITAQSIVINGHYDGINPPEEGIECASLIANCEYVEMMNAGHLPWIEATEDYAKIVLDFLNS